MVLSECVGRFTPTQGGGGREGKLPVCAVGGVGRHALMLPGLAAGGLGGGGQFGGDTLMRFIVGCVVMRCMILNGSRPFL